jgi:anti-anti-sigma regulatory factor
MSVRSLHAPVVSAGDALRLQPRLQRPRALKPGDPGQQEGPLSSGMPVASISARGVIDADHVKPFAAELTRSIDSGARGLLIDLSEAEEVTATGMNALLAARQKLGGRGLISIVLPAHLRHRFEVLQLDRRFLLLSDSHQEAQRLALAPARGEYHARAA